jgi:hypothetical protein
MSEVPARVEIVRFGWPWYDVLYFKPADREWATPDYRKTVLGNSAAVKLAHKLLREGPPKQKEPTREVIYDEQVGDDPS